jgi:WhiB family redox-sensing transcriptional regulator
LQFFLLRRIIKTGGVKMRNLETQGASVGSGRGETAHRELSASIDALGASALFGVSEGEESAWQDRALCAQTDPEAFFPEKGGSTREAKKVCQACDVRTDCLQWAVDTDQRFGIWGGLSERERRSLKKQVV